MKQLKCEMCGSVDLLKQDGVFICQSCGCKYSVEEAKKMMVEVSGSVSVDTPVEVKGIAQVENILKLVMASYESKDFEKTKELCEQIISIDANNYNAWLYKGKCELWQSTLLDLKIEQAVINFDEAIKIAPTEEIEQIKCDVASNMLDFTYAFVEMFSDNYMIKNRPSVSNDDMFYNNYKIMQQVLIPYIEKCGTETKIHLPQMANLIANKAIKGYEYVSFKRNSTNSDGYFEESERIINVLKRIDSLFAQDDVEPKITLYTNIIAILKDIESHHGSYTINGVYFKDKMCPEAKERTINEIMEYHKKIKELDANYVIPERPQQSGGCYVATCVYGSYDCPQVWTLRRFRDNTLAKTILGRAFIRTYYAVSPTIVKWLGNTSWFKKMWKGTLDKMVSKLQENGVENTPYSDRNWR